MDSSPTPFLQSGHNPRHHHRRSSSTLSYGGGLPFYQGGRREPGQGQQGQDHVGRLSSSFDRKLYVDVNKSLSSSMDGKGSVNYLNSVGLNHNDDDGHLGEYSNGEEGKIVEPVWAVVWDVFSHRYGKLDVAVKNSTVWKPLPCLQAVVGGYSADAKVGDQRDLMISMEEMVETLNASLVASSSPWIMPSQHFGTENVFSKPRLLFQYKPYSEQEKLNLTDADITAAMTSVFGEFEERVPGQPPVMHASPLMQASSAGIVILIKLIIDLYLGHGPEVAFPLVLYMLQEPFVRGDEQARCAVLDVILNLMVHSELLYSEEEDEHHEMDTNTLSSDDVWKNRSTIHCPEDLHDPFKTTKVSLVDKYKDTLAEWPPLCVETLAENVDPRKEQFRGWLRRLLFDLAALLVELDRGDSEEVWVSVLSCIVSLCSRDGYIVREYVDGFPLLALNRMIKASQMAFWPSRTQSLLLILAANLFYVRLQADTSIGFEKWRIDYERIEQFGGIGEVVKHYHRSPTFVSCEALFCVMLDYVMHKKTDDQGGTWKFSMDETFEVQALAHAFFETKSAPALKNYLFLPPSNVDSAINNVLAENLLEQIQKNISNSSGDMVHMPFIQFAFKSLKDIGSSVYSVPPDLVPHMESCCVAGIFGEAPSIHWKHLEECLLDPSDDGQTIARHWMIRIMLSSLDRTVEDAWITKKNIIHPPVPLIPSEAPGTSLYTFGDTLMSAFSKCSKQGVKTGHTENGILNFVLAVKEVIGAMRMRSQGLIPRGTYRDSGDLMVKWSSNSLDINRACLSTIEMTLEWILKFGPSSHMYSALVSLAEALVSLLSVRRLTVPSLENLELAVENPMHTFGEMGDEAENQQVAQYARANNVAPLHIPSPEDNQPQDTPSLSPLSKIVPGGPKIAAAWRRLTTPHGKSRPPSSEGTQQLTEPHDVTRPLSAGAATLESTKINAKDLGSVSVDVAETTGKTDQKSLKDTRSLSRNSGSSTSLRSRNKAWQPLTEKISLLRSIQKKEKLQQAVTVCREVSLLEETMDPVESFVTGISTCPVEWLELANPRLLKAIFEAMDIEETINSNEHSRDTPGGIWNSSSPVDKLQVSRRLAAIQGGRPFWDARLAILILFISSYTATDRHRHSHPILQRGYFHKLLKDSDVRVRHHISLFILRRFSHQMSSQYIKAMKSLVSQAQQANDDQLLRNPEASLNKLMEMRLLDLESLYA